MTMTSAMRFGFGGGVALVGLLAACGQVPEPLASDGNALTQTPQVLRRCGGDWCDSELIITRPTLNSIWAAATNSVWAVGENGTTLNWNGTAWRRIPSPTVSSLRAIWGTAANNVWVVGDNGLLMRWNGSAWTRTSTGMPPGLGLNDVHGSGANDVWAVGDEGTVLRYNGTTWSAVAVESLNTLTTVYAQSASSVWMGGELGMLMKWDGTTLAEQPTAGTELTMHIKGSGATRLWRVVEGRLIYQWTGSAWSGLSIYGNWMWFGGDTVGVIADNGTLRWQDGGAWTSADVYPHIYGGVITSTTAGSKDGWAVGRDARILRYNGMSWSPRW